MAEDHYDWWVKRFRQVSTLCDEVRIDHFRGFAAYWSVKAGADTAKEGSWQPGPGEDFFRVLFKQLRNLHLVAEDLGIITDDVCQLKDKLNLPGMQRSILTYYKQLLNNEDENFCALLKRLFDIDGLRGQMFIVTHSTDSLVDDYRNIVRFYRNGAGRVCAACGATFHFDEEIEKHLIMYNRGHGY